MSALTRRTILAATAASAATAGPRALATALPVADSIVALYERRQALVPLCTGEDETVNRIGAMITEIDYEIAETPATTLAGVRIKVALLREFFCIDLRENDGALDTGMMASLLADVDRLGGTGMPSGVDA